MRFITFRRADNRGLSATSAGVALSLAAGLGLFALITDTVTSAGNSAESGTYTPAAGQLAEIALVAADGDCATATYAADTVGSAITSTVDLNDPSWTEYATQDICIRNISGALATLSAQYVNVFETEVGTCESSEFAVEGSGSCMNGDPGELADALRQDVFEIIQAGQGCTSGQGTFAEIMAAPLSLGTIANGETCQYNLGHYLNSSAITENELYAAQTDRVDFDVAFVLTDEVAAPADPNEPNDTIGTATSTTGTYGAIDPATDQDWFAYAHSGGDLNAATSAPDCTTTDTQLTLYAPDQVTEIAFSDDIDTNNLCSFIVAPSQPAGTYYLLVESFNNVAVIPYYDLLVSSVTP